MKISLILLAALFAVVPVLGLSAPSASADELVSYPDVIDQGDIIYFNPNLVVTETLSSYIKYVHPTTPNLPEMFVYFGKLTSGAPTSYDFVCGYIHLVLNRSGGNVYQPFYFYSSDSSLVGVNLTTFGSFYPDYLFLESDLGKPLLLVDSYTYDYNYLSFVSTDLDFSIPVFALEPIPVAVPESSFVDVWGETADFIGVIFVQVGELFYDDTVEELTPIGTLAVILAGIAVVLLVWNLIRSFLPMRG